MVTEFKDYIFNFAESVANEVEKFIYYDVINIEWKV